MNKERKYFWYYKNSLPKGISDEELCKNVIDHVTEYYESMRSFREDVQRYEKIVYFKTNTASTGESYLGSRGIDDTIYSNNIQSSPYLTFNVMKSVVETITNKIGSIQPKVGFYTKDSLRQMRELANILKKWSFKLFKRGNIWSEGTKTFQSAALAGIGVLKVAKKENIKKKGILSFFFMWRKAKKYLEYWNVPILDFFCDNAYYGANTPTLAGEIKTFHLYDLIKMYPKKEKKLRDMHGEYDLENNIVVYEAYKKEERHVICTEKVMLLDEEWDFDVPYIIYNWQKTPQGVLGAGLGKALYPIHKAMTYILSKALTAIENVSTATLFVDEQNVSTLKEAENKTGRIIGLRSGSNDLQPMVKYTTPQPINQQVLEILNSLYLKAFEMVGVNQLAAFGKVPTQLDGSSGVAIRAYEEVQSNRFRSIRTEFENFYINVLKKSLDLSEKDMRPENITDEEIRDLLEMCFVFPESILPDTPAGRLAFVTDIMNTGLGQTLSPDKVFDLLNSPDTDKFKSSKGSSVAAIQIRIENALKDGKKPEFYPPLGLDNYLEEVRKFVGLELKEEQTEEVKKRVKILVIFEKELRDMKTAMTGATQVIQEPNKAPPVQGAV